MYCIKIWNQLTSHRMKGDYVVDNTCVHTNHLKILDYPIGYI